MFINSFYLMSNCRHYLIPSDLLVLIGIPHICNKSIDSPYALFR